MQICLQDPQDFHEQEVLYLSDDVKVYLQQHREFSGPFLPLLAWIDKTVILLHDRVYYTLSFLIYISQDLWLVVVLSICVQLFAFVSLLQVDPQRTRENLD